MNQAQLDAILDLMPVTKGDDGWTITPADRNLTLYAAHEAVALTVSKVQGVMVSGELLRARTHKGELFVLALADLFALSLDGSVTTDRKTGFATSR